MSDFTDNVKQRLRSALRRSEGACGLYHTALAVVSELGGYMESIEVAEGAFSRLIDDEGRVVGEAVDVTWPPSCLKAMVQAGVFPEEYCEELQGVFTPREDLERVKEVFGYGRIVRPVAMALAKLVASGGRAEVSRSGLGVKVVFYDEAGNTLSEASSVFCPACAAMIALARAPKLAREVKEALRSEVNTGKVKAERGIVNKVWWRNFRVEVELLERGRRLGANYGCCTAYAIVRTEAVCGLASPKGVKLIKAYCDQCPVKHVWLGKSMGAMGNVVLKRMSELGLRVELSYDKFLKVTARDGSKVLGSGYGSLCALSGSVNLLLRTEGVKVLRPSPSSPLRDIGVDRGGA